MKYQPRSLVWFQIAFQAHPSIQGKIKKIVSQKMKSFKDNTRYYYFLFVNYCPKRFFLIQTPCFILGCVMFLNQHDDLILLLINTIMRDLQSKNEAEINMALVTGGNRISDSPKK